MLHNIFKSLKDFFIISVKFSINLVPSTHKKIETLVGS
jgi:hypothetical protein